MFQPRALEVEMATGKLKRQKSRGVDEIPAELIEVKDTKIRYRFINVLSLFGMNTC